MHVSQIMSSPVHAIDSRANAREAAARIRETGVMHLVVIDASGAAVGVISDRDLRNAQPSILLVRDQAQREKALSLLRVQDVMTAKPRTVRADDSVLDALHAMRRHRIGSLTVVDARGQPVGIVTGVDVIDLALSLLEKKPAK